MALATWLLTWALSECSEPYIARRKAKLLVTCESMGLTAQHYAVRALA